MLNIAILLTALMAVKIVIRQVLGLDAPIHGYTVVDIIWSVDAFGNGTLVNITGPVQSVYSQLEIINPDLVKNINASSNGTDSLFQGLKEGVRCNKSLDPNNKWWQPAVTEYIVDRIKYLRGVPGKPEASPGPGECGRVSCSYNGAIWWCNDSKEDKTLDSFGDIADCAEQIVDLCSEELAPGRARVLGQNFMPPKDDWNCIVRRDTDNC
ncbi:hypothetical protein V8F20_002677 [Naviculisporaceae sp. PSN 640]